LVKPGGTLIYATCSVLAQENQEQTAWFLGKQPAFAERDYRTQWPLADQPPPASPNGEFSLQLTPHRHETDGFYLSILHRNA
jgi:16S rRNA (cytosine967-C5)-methyltransferase